jgi:hypothetical protein
VCADVIKSVWFVCVQILLKACGLCVCRFYWKRVVCVCADFTKPVVCVCADFTKRVVCVCADFTESLWFVCVQILLKACGLCVCRYRWLCWKSRRWPGNTSTPTFPWHPPDAAMATSSHSNDEGEDSAPEEINRSFSWQPVAIASRATWGYRYKQLEQ